MFTPSMTNEEIEAVAYKDFLEIRGRVEIAKDKFVQRVRCTPPGFWALHSLQETHTLQTRSKNTWTVYFYYMQTTPTGIVSVSSMLYTLLPRNSGTDYLFMNNLDRFHLEILSSHFLRRYRERYIDPNQIQLNGLHPAIYFMRTNGDRSIAFYTPNTWTEQEKKDKYLFVSDQGLMVATMVGRVETYLTFMDQENLSDYRAMVYEEEQLFREFENSMTLKGDKQMPFLRKCYREKDEMRAKMYRFMRRSIKSEKTYKKACKLFEIMWNTMCELVESDAARRSEWEELKSFGQCFVFKI